MPEGDDVYLTIAEATPFIEYIAKAYKILDGVLNFGRESEQEKAIRELSERVATLEQFVTQIDDRLRDLEVKVDQGDNRERIREIRRYQLTFADKARQLNSHPEDAGDIAAATMDLLRAMYEDQDIWLWNDITKKPDDAPTAWRPAPPRFKGVPLPAFAIGTMLWALAAQADTSAGRPHTGDAATIVQWIATRPDWVPYESSPQSLSEWFRDAITAEIVISTKYPNAAGHCQLAIVAVNTIDRTRKPIRDVDLDVGPSTNQMCTVDPRIAAGDEALLEDELPQLVILRALEDAVTAIKLRGTLAQQLIGQFPNWTAERPSLYAIESTGILRRYRFDTTTALVEPPTVAAVGDVVGTGWQNFDQVLGTQDSVLYAVSSDGAVDWNRETDINLGPNGWAGPRRVKQANEYLVFGFSHFFVNGGNGTFYVVITIQRAGPGVGGLRVHRSLNFQSHADVDNGTGALGALSTVTNEWPKYATVFGGGSGVIYGIDDVGDLYWHRHSSWPMPGTQLEGPMKIGIGWNGFSKVFALGDGFLVGVYPSGEMMLYYFVQWQWGPPSGQSPEWRGPVRVPGTQWRGYTVFVPSVGDAPVGGVN